MRAFLISLLAGCAIAAVVSSSNSLAAPANGAAIIEAAQTITFVQDIAYCTRTDNRGRIIFRRPGHCEVVPGFGTRGLSGGAGCSVMVDGADDEENETEVRCRREGEDSA
jgi:hypothetical protein